MSVRARVIGIQEDPVFQQCVEAAEYMAKEHKWNCDVVRNFEYQFHKERDDLASKAAALSGDNNVLTHTDVIAVVAEHNQPLRVMPGPDFISFVSERSDFKLFNTLPDSDPDSYLSLARKNYKKFLKSTGCAFAWLLLKQGDNVLGRVVIQLFADKAPRTCQNFLYLCRGDLPDVKNVEIPAVNFKGDVKLSYKGSKVFRVVKNGWIQAGDIVGDKKGNSGYSIFGQSMPTETMGVVEHDAIGVVGMSWGPGPEGVGGPHTSASSFYITLGPSAWMNSSYCSFGKVVSGLELVRKLGDVPCHHSQAPVQDILIADAGEVNCDV